jgi:uncharacterized protein YebE (UPF0316 family)
MFDYYSYLILPALIFAARICDVSIGTIRIILVAKGYKRIAPFIGFFEVLIWIIAISKIIENLNNWACYIGYAAGFATGNFIGMMIEEKLALGYELIRVITKDEPSELVQTLRAQGYGVTLTLAEGLNGKVGILYIIVSRKKLNKAVSIVHQMAPQAIYTIEDIRHVNREIYFGQDKLKRRRMHLLK